MKTNELRLGNYISVDCVMFKEVLKVTEVCHDGVYANTKYPNVPEIVFIKEEDIEPIELTEKMLVTLLGKPRTNGNKFDIYTIPTSGIEIQDRRKSALPTPTICILKFGVHICNIKYLHQLQNAYYLLTNEELEVEL